MNTNEILSLLGMLAAYLLSFVVAFAIVIGLPLYGIYALLRALTRRR